MSNFVKYSSRPERVADAIVKEAKRGKADLESVVEMHAGQLSRGELLHVLRLLFKHLAQRHASDM